MEGGGAGTPLEGGALALSLLACAAITLAWLWLFVRRDRHPEPPRLIARTFAWGMFAWVVSAAFGASFGRLLGDSWPSLVLWIPLATALVEEGSKFLAASTAVGEADFDEPMDGLVYAVTAALGFAFVENLTYALGFGLGAAALHALLTTLVHALLSAPQGYALGGRWFGEELRGSQGKSGGSGGGRWWRRSGLALSVLLHFVFNGLLTGGAGPSLVLALVAVVGLMLLLARRYYGHFEAHARRQGPPTTWQGGSP